MRLPGIAERPRLAPIPLLGMAAAAAIRGTGYVGTNNPPTQLDMIDTLAPFWVYSIVWFGAAALAATAAVTERAFSAAIATNAALWAVWGGSYVIASAAGWSGRSHLTGSVFLLLALLIYEIGRRERADPAPHV